MIYRVYPPIKDSKGALTYPPPMWQLKVERIMMEPSLCHIRHPSIEGACVWICRPRDYVHTAQVRLRFSVPQWGWIKLYCMSQVAAHPLKSSPSSPFPFASCSGELSQVKRVRKIGREWRSLTDFTTQIGDTISSSSLPWVGATNYDAVSVFRREGQEKRGSVTESLTFAY